MPGVEVFARADGCARRCAYLCHSLGILRGYRIFQPEQVEWFEGCGQADGIVDIVGPMAVQRQLYIGAQYLGDGLNDFYHSSDRFIGQRTIIAIELKFRGKRVEIELDRVKATLADL